MEMRSSMTKNSLSLETEVVHNEELPVVGDEVVNEEDSRVVAESEDLPASRTGSRRT